jgi:hypothetical protein
MLIAVCDSSAVSGVRCAVCGIQIHAVYAVCAAVCDNVRGSVRLCGSARGSVRLSIGAAVCGSPAGSIFLNKFQTYLCTFV